MFVYNFILIAYCVIEGYIKGGSKKLQVQCKYPWVVGGRVEEGASSTELYGNHTDICARHPVKRMRSHHLDNTLMESPCASLINATLDDDEPSRLHFKNHHPFFTNFKVRLSQFEWICPNGAIVQRQSRKYEYLHRVYIHTGNNCRVTFVGKLTHEYYGRNMNQDITISMDKSLNQITTKYRQKFFNL